MNLDPDQISEKNQNSFESEEEKEPKSLKEILIIPRIRLTEKNSLKSYDWWTSKRPKISKTFKMILKKMQQDFVLESYDLKYVFKPVTKNDISKFNDHYVMFGNLILNSNDKQDFELSGVSFYKIEDGQMKFVFIPSTASQSLADNFRPYASSINVNKHEDENLEMTDVSKNSYLIVFKNELNIDELNLIKEKITESLKVDSSKISLIFFENKKYTFRLKVAKNPFSQLKDLDYINGPYDCILNDKVITFKPVIGKDLIIE